MIKLIFISLFLLLIACSESEFTADEFTLAQVNYLKVFCEDRRGCLKAVERQAVVCQNQTQAIPTTTSESFNQAAVAGGQFQFCVIQAMDEQFQQQFDRMFPIKETRID